MFASHESPSSRIGFRCCSPCPSARKSRRDPGLPTDACVDVTQRSIRARAVCDSLAAREPAIVCSEAFACRDGIAIHPFAMGGLDDDAIDRAGGNAKLAAGTKRWQHCMHSLGRADDCVDRTRGDAQCAADAGSLIDACNARRTIRAARGIERLRGAAGECRKRDDGLRTAGWTSVDVRRSCRNRLGVRTAGVISATRALRLRQQRIDTVRKGFLRIHGRILPSSLTVCLVVGRQLEPTGRRLAAFEGVFQRNVTRRRTLHDNRRR